MKIFLVESSLLGDPYEIEGIFSTFDKAKENAEATMKQYAGRHPIVHVNSYELDSMESSEGRILRFEELEDGRIRIDGDDGKSKLVGKDWVGDPSIG